jgi:hypothetical protein
MDDTTGRVTGTGGAYDENPDVRTREIREEIAQTRVEMSETIEAIQERLTPGNLAAQAGETVRNAATEKVKQMAHTAEHAAEQIRESSFVETLRANPIPSAMIGIGAAWLMLKGRSQGGRARRYGDYPRYRVGAARDWRNETYVPTAVGTSGSTAATSGSAVGASGSTLGTSGYDYGAGYSGDSGRVPEFGGDIRGYQGSSEGSYQGTGSYGSAYGSSYQRSSMSVDRVVRENPLAIGAAAALVGVAIGLSIPATETENRVLGEARDSVVDRARDMATEATDKVKGAVGLDTGPSNSSQGRSNAGGSNVGGSNVTASSTSEPNFGESNTGGASRSGSSRRGSNRSSLS